MENKKHYFIQGYQRFINGKTLKCKVLFEYKKSSRFHLETTFWRILIGVRILEISGDDIVEFRTDMELPVWKFKSQGNEWSNIIIEETRLNDMKFIQTEDDARLIFEVGDD